MAPTLRYISKFPARLLTSKHLRVFPQIYFTNQSKQYYRSVQSPVPETSYNDTNTENTDNREIFTDIINKVKVERLNVCNRLSATAVPKEDVVLSSGSPEDRGGRPSPEKLHHIFTMLAESLPKFFIQPLDYSMYHDDIVFEDHIRNLQTVGLLTYVKQMALIRTVGHLKFAYVKLEVLKMTQHPEDGTVRVRWRIRGISALKIMLLFWRYKIWELKEMFEKSDSWYDGYSTFVVNADGKIVKHIADKMMPDSDSVTAHSPSDLNNAKLALMVAVVPRFSDLGWLM